MSLSLSLFGVPGLLEYLHPVTLSYVQRIQLNSGSISTTEINCVDLLIKDLFKQNLWEKITFLWTPFGSFPNGVLVPLKHPRNSILVNNGFVSNEYNIKTGIKGNTVSFLNTQTTELDYPVNTNTHIGLQLTNIGTNGDFREVGVRDFERFQIILSFGGTNLSGSYYRTYSINSGIEEIRGNNTTLPLGFYQGQRDGVNASYIVNGAVISSVTRENSSETPTNNEISIFRAASTGTNRGISYVSIGKSMTNTESLSYANIVNSFQSRRNVL